MTEISMDLESAKKLLDADELIAIPTETVYGLAANAFSEHAVKQIFELKNRPSNNPLIIHIASISELEKYALNIPLLAWELAAKFWPGPLTLLLEKKAIIPNCVTAGNTTVAIRIPNHQLTLALLSKLAYPLAAPSANPYMSISPTKPEHVKKYFDGKLKFILDGGFCQEGIESTIIGFREDQAVLYRAGSCETAEIEKITGKLLLPIVSSKIQEAPGMTQKHYAPTTPLIVASSISEEVTRQLGKKIGVLTFLKTDVLADVWIQKHLSDSGNLKEASVNLYSSLIELDHLNLDVIITSYVQEDGIGVTINDRLRRASFR